MLALLATTALFAQNKVTGTVTDNVGPVIGASVMEKGTSNGAITDLDGNYTITVRPGATLVFSSIGYATQEIAVGSQSVNDMIEGDRLPDSPLDHRPDKAIPAAFMARDSFVKCHI